MLVKSIPLHVGKISLFFCEVLADKSLLEFLTIVTEVISGPILEK